MWGVGGLHRWGIYTRGELHRWGVTQVEGYTGRDIHRSVKTLRCGEPIRSQPPKSHGQKSVEIAEGGFISLLKSQADPS